MYLEAQRTEKEIKYDFIYYCFLIKFLFLIHIHNTFKLKIQENNRGAVQNKLTFLAEMSAKGVFKTLVLLNLNLNF